MNSIGSFGKRLCRPNILTSLLTLSSFQLVNHSTANMAAFQANKDRYLSMSLEDKRKQYVCGDNYITLNMIPVWHYSRKNAFAAKDEITETFEPRPDLNNVISIFSGDITKLEIDAIVNAANSRLAGGGGVDGFIHRAAGHDMLQEECSHLGGCQTGSCKITGGYRLPAKYILHCVGPVGEKPDLLASCYKSALNLAVENGLKTVAFPCISTGVYGYPNRNAAKVVLKTVRQWLESNPDKLERIIFCLFLQEDLQIYEQYLPLFFPSE